MKKAYRIIVVLTLLIGVTIFASDVHKSNWDYTEHGPYCWGEFSDECKIGHLQSPIDIQTKRTKSLKEYLKLKINEDISARGEVIDNGHSIQVNVSEGGYVISRGIKYNLVQFHFHGHSEHTINGKHHPIEGHFVHKSDEGKLLVIAIIFNEGLNNPALDTIIGGIGASVRIDPQDLFPKDISHYYHYIGSLTTPPCTEGVDWYIFSKAVSASLDQIQTMRKYYNDNYRPIQSLHHRKIDHK